MDEIKELLDAAKVEGLMSEEVIRLLFAATNLLVDKVEELEEKIKNLSS